MKKRVIWVLLLLVVILIGLYSTMPKSFADVVADILPAQAQYFVYCHSFDGEYIVNGSGCIVQTDRVCINSVLSIAQKVSGVSVRFSGDKTTAMQYIQKLNLQDVSISSVGEIVTICGYSHKIVGGVVADGITINVQIACDGTTVHIGSPLILGSF